jgi:chitin disaccharide deacetylase
MMTRHPLNLIVNGDDFGASEEVNKAIIRAHQKGVLTSCSLMIAGDAVQQAVSLARQNPNLAVGLHLVTVRGRSVLPPEKIPTLVDENGYFGNDPTLTGLKYYFSERARTELSQELDAQFLKFVSTGLKCSHVDSHLHMHIHPVIFQNVIELCRRFDVLRMRVPEDDCSLCYRLEGVRSVKKILPFLIFRLLCRQMRKRLSKEGFICPERVYGHLYTGEMTEEIVLSTLHHMHCATNEMYFHPALFASGETLTNMQQQCKRELEILMSSEVKAKITSLGIQLSTYAEL